MSCPCYEAHVPCSNRKAFASFCMTPPFARIVRSCFATVFLLPNDRQWWGRTVRSERAPLPGASSIAAIMSNPEPADVPISVVIAARNRPAHLERLLKSLRAQTLQSQEVIVVDDGSQPRLPPLGETLHLRNEISEGACRARNLGFRKASGKYVFIFDDDAELQDSSLLERSVRLAEKLPRVGVIGFRQLNSEGQIHWMQPASGEQLRLVPSFGGYGALVSRAAFEAVGGFFEPLGYYWEENELSIKMIDRGFQIVYDPSLQVTHHENQEGRNHRVIHRLCWRNTLYTIAARYPLVLVPAGVGISTLRWIRLSRSWKQFRWGDLAWGFANLFRSLPQLISHRKPVRLRTVWNLRRWRAEVVVPKLD
jgi:GT2 family glycosyltransferase